MEEARELYARGITLTIDLANGDLPPGWLASLQTTLTPFCGGQCPIQIEYRTATDKATLQLGDDWRVRPSDELLIRLRRLLSNVTVLVRY